MKVVAFWALTITIALPKLLFATLFSVSELGGEVATFKGPNIGSDVLVRLWIVDQRDSTWIEHGVRPSINQSINQSINHIGLLNCLNLQWSHQFEKGNH